MSSAGDARRRAEIEAKRAKLAELRRTREERSQRLKATSSTLPEYSSATTRKDLDDLVDSLIGPSGSIGTRTARPSLAGSEYFPSSPRKSAGAPASSDFGGSESEVAAGAIISGTTVITRDNDAASSSRYVPELIDVETELFELPQRERVFYTKEVQTASFDDSEDDGPSDAAGGVGTETRDAKFEESIRAKILKEQAEELASRHEEERLEKEIEEQLRELTDEERLTIYGASDFSEFVEQSSKIVERALADSYDYMRDYRVTGDNFDDANQGRQLRLVRTFWDEKVFGNRSITDLDWSTKYPELCVASYNRNEMASDDPDGLVAIWNMHLIDRPEFIFHAQTDVLSVAFSPFHPNLVIGGTYSGQILIWDTRARALPVLKTPLSAAGHTHPVYSLKMVGTQNAHNLITASTDGTVCSWMLDMLARPQETLELLNTSHPKTDEVSITSLGFPDQETTSFWVGTEEGNVYAASRYDRAGSKAGLHLHQVYRGHSAPITALDFHPLSGSVDFSDLFLTSSMDWTTKLWRAKTSSTTATTSAAAAAVAAAANSSNNNNNSSSSNSNLTTVGGTGTLSTGTGRPSSTTSTQNATVGSSIHPILYFEEASDYVYDIGWHPFHPAVFAQVDGSGRLDVYNLNQDIERPIQSVTIASGRAINKLSWDKKDGKHCAVAGADGHLYIYDIADHLSFPLEEDFQLFQKNIARLLNPSATAAVVATGSNNTTTSSNPFQPVTVR